MAKNEIEFLQPDTAMVTELKRLEREFEQLKHASQPPSIIESSIGSVSFSIAPIGATTIYGVKKTFRHTVIATLTPPNSEVLMAIPEFSIYVNSLADANHYPSGFSVAGLKQYQNILSLKWWLSWALNNDKNLVAIIDLARQDYGGNDASNTDNNPDGTTPNTLNFLLYMRWRFLTPGAG